MSHSDVPKNPLRRAERGKNITYCMMFVRIKYNKLQKALCIRGWNTVNIISTSLAYISDEEPQLGEAKLLDFVGQLSDRIQLRMLGLQTPHPC